MDNDIWIMSLNIKTYDVVGHFKTNDTLVWKKTRPFIEGDTVFLYIAKPYGRVMYQCTVEESSVGYEEIKSTLKTNTYTNGQSSSKFMRLRLLCPIENEELTFENLRMHGVGQLLNPSRLSKKTRDFFKDIGIDLESSHEK